MGVVNVTPDSFVHEVATPTVESAVARCLKLAGEGAAMLDIGGESTRPGAEPVSLDEELGRVLPVLEAVLPQLDPAVQISIDTQKEAVARAAVAAGARIINDMGRTLGDVAGALGVGYVAAHMLGTPATMQDDPRYHDVIALVLEEVMLAGRKALAAGAFPVWIDPGIGFGKTVEHNLSLLAHIDQFVARASEEGLAVLVGVSRKGFVGRLHTASDRRMSLDEVSPTPTDDRIEGSVALAVWAASLGVDVVRVHDVSETVQALQVVAAGIRPSLGG